MTFRIVGVLVLCLVQAVARADGESALTFEPRLAMGAFQDESAHAPRPEIDVPIEDWRTIMRHRGFMWRISGLVVQPQNDGVWQSGETFGFDTGGGIAIAFGYRFVAIPLSLDIEYAYRAADADSGSFDSDNDIRLNTITANFLFDETDMFGPVGIYAGAGVGVRIEEFRYTSVGGASVAHLEGSGFYWQARAGLTVSLGDRIQLFGGVTYSDAGDLGDENVYVDSEMLGAEIGLRFFF